eukprot:scaffold157727_cov16-Prasinocladus_malaysianus.AAC.1
MVCLLMRIVGAQSLGERNFDIRTSTSNNSQAWSLIGGGEQAHQRSEWQVLGALTWKGRRPKSKACNSL